MNSHFEDKPNPDNQNTPDLTPDELLAVKDDLFAMWQRLPPEHQATVTLVLVSRVLAGEWGGWFRQALTIQPTTSETTQDVPYIRAITPDDLRHANVSEEKIAQLSETDFSTIAKHIYEQYITDAIWEEIAFVTDLVLAAKKRKP